jgi:branched-chain amino acid transport system permease protein
MALGKSPDRYRGQILMVSSGAAAVAGVLYAQHLTHVGPMDFGLNVSLLVVAMVVLGGAATRWGPVLGATVLVALPEGLRFLGLTGPLAENLIQMVYGLLLVGAVFIRPQGLMGSREGTTG